ncbi:MAG TPA: type II toxin-antitoxin system VapC family toxin [Solirubrobacterales bacterium]
MTVVLDTWALIALLKDEPAAARVETAWLAETPVMCSLNLGEALYMRLRVDGAKEGLADIERVRAELNVVDPDWRLVRDSATIKSSGGLSFADCFALATARRYEAPLWTGDPEIIELADPAEIIDLR